MRPFAIIESDKDLIKELRSVIESAGFRIDCFENSRTALPHLLNRMYSLAIVDLAVDDADPFAVCREASALLPVIVVNSESNEDTCIRAFESGADDCLCRPFNGRELIARIHNVLRRAGSDQHTGSQTLGTMSRFATEMRVRCGDESVDLTRGEAEILRVLLDHGPGPMTSAQIAKAVGANQATIASRIKSLRRKLGPDRFLSRGRLGYQLSED